MDVSRKLNDKTVFIFRQCPPEQQPFAVLSFHESDKLRFLSNSENAFVITDFIDRLLDASDLTQAISYYWKAKQWKIKGAPFNGDITHGADLRLMVHHLSRILKHFHHHGWRLVASGDISAKYHSSDSNSYPLDTHSWFFLYDPDSMIASDTAVVMEDTTTEDAELELLTIQTVAEIKSEKSQMRYFLNVVLPIIFICLMLLYYVYTILW